MTHMLEVQRDGVTIFAEEIMVIDPAIFPTQVKDVLEAFLIAQPEVSLFDSDLGIVIASAV